MSTAGSLPGQTDPPARSRPIPPSSSPSASPPGLPNHCEARGLAVCGTVLTLKGPAVVGTLPEATDQAVGNVSDHLRVLASAELIEETPELARNRRERWWRLVSDAAWHEGCAVSAETWLRLTAEETRQVAHELTEVLTRAARPLPRSPVPASARARCAREWIYPRRPWPSLLSAGTAPRVRPLQLRWSTMRTAPQVSARRPPRPAACGRCPARSPPPPGSRPE